MRLNLFLPFPERSKKRTIARRSLKKLGVTWLYSPARRIFQTVCVILFLFLFLYVCWPYGSREYAKALQAKELLEAEIFLVPESGGPPGSESRAGSADIFVHLAHSSTCLIGLSANGRSDSTSSVMAGGAI